jgi:hypothetical protein
VKISGGLVSRLKEFFDAGESPIPQPRRAFEDPSVLIRRRSRFEYLRDLTDHCAATGGHPIHTSSGTALYRSVAETSDEKTAQKEKFFLIPNWQRGQIGNGECYVADDPAS